MRILYITTIGLTMGFFKSLIKDLIDNGNVVDIATNETEIAVPSCFREWGCKVFQISTSRFPFSIGNIKAVKEIERVSANYDIVHCHTPIAAAATRVACKGLRKHGLKVIYTAHGFHFYKGAPLKNWLIYYPIEKVCAHWTDVIITINKEDYELAQKKMKGGIVEYIPGVGIDTEKFKNTVVDRAQKRKEIGVPEDAFLVLSVGELNENKNHRIVIEALGKINDPNIHYVIAGKGNQKDALENLANELRLASRLHLIGYRDDVSELYKTADIYALPSFREGLNVSIMEALSAGLPVICSNIRGNTDMVEVGNNGYLFSQFDMDSVADCLKRAKTNRIDRGSCLESSFRFDSSGINDKIMNIYESMKRG